MPANGASTSRYLEVDSKFDADESTQPPSFDGIAAVSRVEHAETESLDAVYFDTPSRDLALNRVTLRRRTAGPPHRRPGRGWAPEIAGGPRCPHRSAGAVGYHRQHHGAHRAAGCCASH